MPASEFPDYIVKNNNWLLINIVAGENLPLNINLKYIFFTEWKCLHYSKSPTCLFWKIILYVLTITLPFDTNIGRLLCHVTNSHWLLPLNYHFLQLFWFTFFLINSLDHWNAYWKKPKRSAWRWSEISVFSRRDNSRQCFATTCSQYIGYKRGHLHCPTFSETAKTNNRLP